MDSDVSGSTNISDLAEMSFSAYSSIDSFEIDEPKTGCVNPLNAMVDAVFCLRTKSNLSYSALSNIAQSMNDVPGAQLRISTTKHMLKRDVRLLYKYERTLCVL